MSLRPVPAAPQETPQERLARLAQDLVHAQTEHVESLLAEARDWATRAAGVSGLTQVQPGIRNEVEAMARDMERRFLTIMSIKAKR